MGSGKTTVAHILADRLGWKMIDTDAVIEQHEQSTCSQIISTRGIDYFRTLENDMLTELAETDLSNTIIATGGGMPCSDNNISILKSAGIVIYLKWKASDLVRRLLLTDLSNRPRLKDRDETELEQFVEHELALREPYYSQAYLTINAPCCQAYCTPHDDDDIATQIITNLNL